MTKKMMVTIASSILVGMAVGALAVAAHAQIPGSAVTIDNFTFGPQLIKVKTGDIVTWTNHDDIPHTVRSTTAAFKSNALDTDEKFSFTFAAPGKYDYFCSLHPTMTGSIVVEADTGK
jgi:plastocyanin